MNNENLKDVYEKQNKKKVSRLSKNIGKAFIAVALGFGEAPLVLILWIIRVLQ